MSEGFLQEAVQEGSMCMHQFTFKPCGQLYVLCVAICPSFTYAMMIIAQLHKEIRRAIPSIVECLSDLDDSVRAAAVKSLSSLAAHRVYYHLSPFDMLNPHYSQTS